VEGTKLTGRTKVGMAFRPFEDTLRGTVEALTAVGGVVPKR
jgi:hypothetical protein